MIFHMEAKVLSFPSVRGIAFGNWGQASEDTHRLVATSRARVAKPKSSRREGGT